MFAVPISLVSMLATAAPAPASRAMSDAQVTAALQAHVDSLAGADAFSGAILFARGDQVLLRKAYGFASQAEKRPNRPDTKFNIGSINKQFTHVAIAQLAAAGKLGLGDTISRYLPDYPIDKGGKITIQELLDHRAGTGRMFGDRMVEARDRLRTIRDYMDVVRDEPLLFEPGTRQEYSNTGYVLLGAIIERVSGQSYYDFVREHVYRPAGMKSTDSYARDESVPNLAIGYTRPPDAASDAPRQSNQDFLPMRGSSAGGGYSTVDDLERFADALRAGRLGLPPVQGMGFAGGTMGVNAMVEIAGPYTVIALANYDPPAAEQVTMWTRDLLVHAGAIPPIKGGQEVGGPPLHQTFIRGGPGGPGEMQRPHGPQRTALPATPVVVPMAQAGHLPLVQVTLNGRGPFRFAIDTGAAGSLRVDSTLMARLGLEPIGEVQAGDPSGRNRRSMPLVQVDSLSIGGARFGGLVAAVRSYNEPMAGRDSIDGIIGFGLFEHCLFTLDYPAHLLRIERGTLPEANGRDILEFDASRGIPNVALDVDGHTLPADVDAGSMGGFMLPDSLMSQLHLASEPRVVGRARTVSNTFEIRAADLSGTIALGGLRFEHPTVTFQPVMGGANVGSRVLSELRITFDQQSRRVKLERAAAGAANPR
ncbi:MAG TPA: serine hydrolase [Candidatus Sulfotelmatobacter sp.]|nr:serine hydrolase [Candidatus Sulfotelmatobacter sp.]